MLLAVFESGKEAKHAVAFPLLFALKGDDEPDFARTKVVGKAVGFSIQIGRFHFWKNGNFCSLQGECG